VIAIFDYGAGNLRSVQNTLDEIGSTYTLVRDSAGLRAATKIILPGVGHFGQMMQALDNLGVRQTLCDCIADNVPFFGICLGMQAMLEGSEEAPGIRGLGLLPGTVRRFPADARVPHMGWNQPDDVTGATPRPSEFVYFAHSYYVPVNEYVASEVCTYGGIRFMASLQNGNAFGVQYHPEKSGAAGLRVVESFVKD
jgi:imidazole glycerol-phosphate synthase subunit HisH